MSVQPVRKEVQELQFKLLTQIKLFSSQSLKLDNPTSLVATASKFGLIFVGIPSGFTCFFTATIINIQKQRANNRGYITSFPRRDIKLNGTPSHIAISSDNEQLAVAVVIDTCPILLIYNVNAFVSVQIKTKCEIRMGNTPGVTVADLQWNPGVANVISAAMSDGSAYVYEIKDGTPTISSIPPNSQASCLCWSPKGKQIVIGAKNGSLTQYKPDLKAVKTFPPPGGIFNQPEVVSVQWLSNYQFIATYKDKADASSKPAVMIVNAPKSSPPSFVNHEDICYGFGTNRPEHYFIHQQQWCVIIIGSSNSSEIAVLGQNNDSWDQWMQDESNRAQLPVSEDYQDVYLTGLAIDYSSQAPIPIGENSFLNPMPLLLMYSQEGVLCFFHIINLFPNAFQLCHSPVLIPDQSGIHLFTDVPQIEKSVNTSRPEESGQIKSFGSEISKQPENVFKLASLGSNVSFGPVKEATPQTSQSPFAALNLQKSNNTFAPNSSLGQLPAFGGFGMMMDNNKTIMANKGFFTTPKFSTSTPIISQQSSAAATNMSFNMPPVSHVVTSVAQESSSNSILRQQQQQQQQQQNKGLSSMFQAPNTVAVTSTPTSFFNLKTDTPEVNQVQSKPPLLATPSQTTQQLIIPQSTSVPAKAVLEKESKDPAAVLSTTASGVMTQIKDESEVSQLNQVTAANEEEKEESLEVDFISPIKEKVADFNAEILNLQKFKKNLNFSIDIAIINDIVTKINELKTFEKDLKETTSAQEGEVSGLINNVVEMFSWLENVKSKQKQINNPKYLDLMESQGVDPVLKKHMQNIEQYFYYLETQIKQAKIQLDSLWSKRKDKPQKSLELPNMEAIYQTIVAENYILAAQKVRITELEVRLKEKIKLLSRKVPKISDFSSFSSIKSNSNGDLDVLADKLLLFKCGQSDTHASIKSGFEENLITSSSQKYLSQKKELLIHKWHKNHVVINTKPNKRQPITEIPLTKYPNKSINSPLRSSDKSDQKQTVSTKSIFTITKPSTFSSQISNESEQKINLKDKNADNVNSTALINQKPEPPTELRPQLPQSKNEITPDMSGGDVSDKFGTGLQISYSNNVNYTPSLPIYSPKGGAVTTTNPSRLPVNTSLIETNVKTNLTNPELKIASIDLNSASTKQESDKTLQQTAATVFESNFFSKAITTNPPSFINPTGVTTTTDIQPKNVTSTAALIPSQVSFSTNVTEIKDGSKKENVETVPDARKEVSSENTKVSTSFLFSGMSFVSTPGNVTVTSSVSPTNPPSINIFGNAPLTGQNTMSTLNFTKSPIFSDINTSQTNTTTPVKTTSIFGAPVVSGNTASSPTPSIFGGKPLASQFMTGSPTFAATSTPAITPNVTPVSSKPAPSAATSVAAPVTTTFFCKPSSMKALFANSQLPPTNAATIFKTTPSTLGTPIFATTQPQQDSASTAVPTSLIQTSSPVSTSSSTAAIPANSIPVTTTLTSGGISSAPVSLTFSPPPVTSTIESNTTNISPTQPESNVTSATTSLITSSTDTTSASAAATEKELTTTSTTSSTFGITSTVPSIFGAKSTEQNVPVFSPSGSSSPSNSFGKTVTTAGFTPPISTETSIFASKPSIFGNQNTTITFGSGSTTAASSIFSTAAPATFGTPSTKTTTTPLFGTPATFGTPTTSNASVFGAAAALSSTSFFGNTPATTTSAFGTTPTASPFSSTPATTSTSFFGQPVCSPTSTVTNVFSNISFAQKSPAVTTAGSIFGGIRSTFEPKPLFQSGGVFGQPTSTPGSFGTSGGSLFGGKSTFGSPQQQPNLFQSSTGASGTLFSSGNTSGGSFSTGGNQSVAQSGFGAVPHFQTAAKPFGNTSPSGFGTQSSGFGSAPTFGGSATFGSPNKMFGSLSPGTGAFGSPTQQSSTFENLAGQNTLTFGNLAQGQPTFNSSPSFGSPQQQQQQTTFPTTSTFGGSSFSTWR